MYASVMYGLAVRSELPLHQQRPLTPDSEAQDFTITLGAPMKHTEEAPAGKVLISLMAKRQYYTGTVADDGYRLRFYGTCDVLIDHELSRATVFPVAGADLDILSVLVSGSLLAFVLAMQGAPVLHASAVQVGSQAMAFTGGSGMGKSTCATLLCAGGAKLITDDLLRLDLQSPRPLCRLGATEARLRKSAAELSSLFPELPSSRETGDARDALALEPATQERLPLHAIVVPLPRRENPGGEPEVQRLDKRSALMLLVRFPRLLGWSDPGVLASQFHQLGEVVDRVPVYVAHLPWGPPFPRTLAADLLADIGLDGLPSADEF